MAVDDVTVKFEIWDTAGTCLRPPGPNDGIMVVLMNEWEFKLFFFSHLKLGYLSVRRAQNRLEETTVFFFYKRSSWLFIIYNIGAPPHSVALTTCHIV